MTAYMVDTLAAADPSSPIPDVPPVGTLGASDRWAPFRTEARDRFLAKYLRTDFGYHIARIMANHDKTFPMPLMGRDAWVYRAYLMMCRPGGNFNKHVAEAYHLATFVRSEPDLGSMLKAMLMSFHEHATWENHLAAVSARTGIAKETIEAFEILFFNVYDRACDGAYLACEFYPDTRAVEFDEDYLRNSSHAELLKRVAYNHRDLGLSAYLAGIGDHTYLKKLAASDDRESELTRFIMGNGLLLTHSNMLNQKSVGMQRASQLLAATRQSGNTAVEPPIGGIAPMFGAKFARVLQLNNQNVAAQMREDAGLDMVVS
jgi:hypothetical protein